MDERGESRMKRMLVVFALVGGMLVPMSSALAEPIEVGCRDADVTIRVYQVACIGIHYP